jgi:hypothetical protein
MPIVAFACFGILVVAWIVAPKAARERTPLAGPEGEVAVPAAA